ncbi:MAG: hypothetical protein EOO11_02265 [Chitinophagaceae bacterium]|nr:MAG: hypothetical protein EOO11_02265 [Chitinophagaceae bacterium]
MKSVLLAAALLVFSRAASAQAEIIPPPAPSDTVLQLAPGEVAAEYPGGAAAWAAYLQKSLNWEAAARDLPKKTKRFEQTAQVQFIVAADGRLSNIHVLNNVLPSIRMEAVRVIRASGKWNPAQQGGRPARAYRTQPITFVFE